MSNPETTARWYVPCPRCDLDWKSQPPAEVAADTWECPRCKFIYRDEPLSITEEAFRKWEGDWIDNWDGVEPAPDRLAIFRAGWDAAFNHFMDNQP